MIDCGYGDNRKEDSLLILLMVILCVLMFLRNDGAGFVMLGVVWLSAATFNPPVHSNIIWFIGFSLGYLLSNDED